MALTHTHADPTPRHGAGWRRITLLIVLAYEALGCLYGGTLLIIEPDGRLLQMPVEMLHGAFRNFLVPGLFLFTLGWLNAAAFVTILRNRRPGRMLAVLAMGGLVVWFIVEIVVLRELHWLHAMWGLPVLLGGWLTLSLPKRPRPQ